MKFVCGEDVGLCTRRR